MTIANSGADTLLQNHPGEPVYPVGPTGFAELSDQKRAAIQAVATLGALVFLLGVFIVGLSTEGPEFAVNVALSGAVTCLVGGILLGMAFALLRRAGKVRMREQQHYYELGQLKPLSLERREALQLDGVNTGMNGWCETLEGWPCETRLPKPIPEFRTLAILTVQQSMEELDQSWGVLNGDAYHNMIKRLFDGMHSLHFAHAASGPDAQAMFQRMSDLLGEDAVLVEAAARREPGQPPRLLWAFDIWRALRLSRDAYTAALISEEEAWETIQKASAWIHTIFSDLSDYQFNLRLGHAFWSNDLAQVNERKRVLDGYLANDARRPICDLPWRRATAALPPYVQDGFEAARKQEESHSLELRESEPPGSGVPPELLN